MLLGLAAGAVATTGNFNNLAATVFGFLTMPLIFAGMIIILPGKLMHAPEVIDQSPKPMLKTRSNRFSEKTEGEWLGGEMAGHNFG